MREYLEIGAYPPEEECVQVGEDNYDQRANEECRKYIEAIRGKLGREPEGARLAIKSFPHDLGRYREVVCYYDENFPESVAYAYLCESNCPTTWADNKPLPTPGILQRMVDGMTARESVEWSAA